MTGTLGVSTFDYFPYCFLNLINPVISVLYGLTGFQVKYLPADEASVDAQEAEQPELSPSETAGQSKELGQGSPL